MLHPEDLSLREVVRSAISEVQSIGEPDGITVTLRSADGPDTVQGERIHLENLFSNLIRNAIEASRPNESVTVNIQRDTDFLIDIHNSGVIPADIRDRFFDQYVTSGKPDGSGIGTYVARLIAEVHGGSIDFSTAADTGTHLYVRLPFEAPTQSGIQENGQ